MTPIKLDQPRKDILAATGNVFIEGGPGCGKTTIALLKAADCAKSIAEEQRILFLSFSRAAVRQVIDRMRGTLTPSERAILEVRTFHAFFLDVVRSHGRLLTGAPARFVTPERESLLRADFEGDKVAWAAEKRRMAADDSLYVFDTLAPTVADILERSAHARALYSHRYPVVVVDEFQDTSIDQWRVIQALSAGSTIICLADPDQRIFDHLDGVDEHRLIEAKEVLGPKTFDLSADNHRSPTSGLLDFANAVLHNTPASFPPNVHYFAYRNWDRPELIAHSYARRVLAWLKSNVGSNATLAVLTPENKFAAQVSEALSETNTLNGESLPPVDHTLFWDIQLASAAALVVASILEWPTKAPEKGAADTLVSLVDYYRVKLGTGTAGARGTINTLENAISAIRASKAPRAKTAKLLLAAAQTPPPLLGRPVQDWQTARKALTGSTELVEIDKRARQIRLLRATDNVAWALTDSWNGADGYVGAVDAVRTALAAESVDAHQRDDTSVHVMTLHKSKGKEYDAVIIVESRYGKALLRFDADAKAQASDRRVLRVGITRARQLVVIVRPTGVPALTPAESDL